MGGHPELARGFLIINIMKTIKDIKIDIQTMLHSHMTTAENNKVENLRKLAYYLETNPAESFIISERDRIKKRIDMIKDQYPDWLKNCADVNNLKNPKSAYEKEMGLPALRFQLKNLEYLLSE